MYPEIPSKWKGIFSKGRNLMGFGTKSVLAKEVIGLAYGTSRSTQAEFS